MVEIKRILCIGASGYGNVGDDGYRLAFTQYLPEFELCFDSPFPDINAVKWADAVVVGGGGLIYCNETAHFNYMAKYLNHALKQGKPIGFLSAGIQIRPSLVKESFLADGPDFIAPWEKYLAKASFICVRSQMCYDIIKKVAPQQENLHYFPDACYLLKPPGYKLTPPDVHVLIPTPSSVKSREFKLAVKALPKKERVYIAAFATDDIECVRAFEKTLVCHQNLISRTNLFPLDAMAILSNAKSVITGRYHGAVFARAAGLAEECITAVDRRYKAQVERPPADLMAARLQFDIVRQHWGS